MLRNYLGIINLDEDTKDIRALTTRRNTASVPIGGRYRVIDFALSNMVNAGINHVCVFSENSTRSLSDHLSNGRPWDLDRKIGGLYIIHNGLMEDILNSDKRVFENNMDLLDKITEDNIIISSSYMLCNIDLEAVAEAHEKAGAQITAVYKSVTDADIHFVNCNTFNITKTGKISSAARNIGRKKEADICMEIFVMKKELLCDLLFKAANEGLRSKLKDYIAAHISEYDVYGYKFEGYLSCVNTIDNFYRTNMDMLNIATMGSLFNKTRPIYTKTKDSPPVKYYKNSFVSNSLVADGTVVKGKIVNSVVSRGVIIEEGAEIDGCVILQNAIIGKDAKLINVIVDKGVVIEENSDIRCPKHNPLTLERKSRFKG
ncbi:MAG: glucose-1-phosphate adenylyltransferase subunit GlgD [Clostridia bacterium]|nr:glucose-1-phosphate adenylyltransferase subunit GlgD [Clostridia bacterium]